MWGKRIWAKSRNIVKLEDCYFYHTIDLPGYGTIQGDWDLRNREPSYLGNVNFQGKSVLELGTANGYLCFYMEKQGANVTAYDLSKEQEWDIVPYVKYDYKQQILLRKEVINKINNAFWLAHRLYKSNAKMVYGTVYEIPDAIGEFDICTFGCILLHLRDPFLALQRASPHIKDMIIITDKPNQVANEDNNNRIKNRTMRFLPDSSTCEPFETWWELSPELLTEFIKILGFEHTQLTYHTQLYRGYEIKLFTLVGRRS